MIKVVFNPIISIISTLNCTLSSSLKQYFAQGKPTTDHIKPKMQQTIYLQEVVIIVLTTVANY